MKKAFLLILMGFTLAFVGCKPKQVVVEKEKLVYIKSDTTIVHDSTVYIPTEIYRDYSSILDTLYMSTTLAESKAWVDTNTYMLLGELKNKKAVEYRYIEVEKIVKNDSIVYQEKKVPYEVEVIKTKTPTWAWICLVWAVVCLCYGAWKIYKKFWL